MFNRKKWGKKYNKSFKRINSLKLRHNSLIKKGMCPHHIKHKLLPGKKVCKICMERNKLRNKKNRKELKKNGRCQRCNKYLTRAGKSYCRKCAWKITLGNHSLPLNDIQATRILEKQKYKCVLSGILLKKGVNASPDHIIPIGKNRTDKNHPLNNIKNFRFLDIDINYMRRNYSDRKFKNLCKKVANYKK